MCDIVNDFKAERLPVRVENGVAIDVYPEEIPAVGWPPLLRPKPRSFAYIGHDPWSFSFALSRVFTVPGVDWRVAVETWVVLGLSAWVCIRLLDADYVHVFSESSLQDCDVAR